MKSPSSLTLFRRAKTAFDHLTLYFMFPSVKILEDHDYETHESGIIKFELDLPTHFGYSTSDKHWTIKARILGFGVTIVRQKGY